MNTEIRKIVFDLGNVLLDFDLRLLVRGLQKYSRQAPIALEEYFFNYNETIALFEKGHISPEEFFLKLKDMLQLDMDFGQFSVIWCDIFMLRKKIVGVLEALKREQMPLYILSNTNELHFQFVKKKFARLFSFFDDYILSHKVGFRKPEQEIYHYLIQKLKVKPEEIFFIDDIAANIEGARQVGIQTHLFHDEDLLEKAFLKTIHFQKCQ